MKFLVDIHVHTISSRHAYSTFDENARWAKEKGLKVLGISDHVGEDIGGAHEFHFTNSKVIPRKVYGMTILRGAETNIIDYNGTIDMPEYVLKMLDYVITSYHPPCIKFGEINEVTKGMIGAMHNPYVKIIGHPGDSRYPLHFEEVVKASKETGTILEVNNASLKPISVRPNVRESLIEILKYCNKYDVPILANTDAHICYDVGEFEETVTLLEEVKFPKELILNLYPDKLLNVLGCKL